MGVAFVGRGKRLPVAIGGSEVGLDVVGAHKLDALELDGNRGQQVLGGNGLVVGIGGVHHKVTGVLRVAGTLEHLGDVGHGHVAYYAVSCLAGQLQRAVGHVVGMSQILEVGHALPEEQAAPLAGGDARVAIQAHQAEDV